MLNYFSCSNWSRPYEPAVISATIAKLTMALFPARNIRRCSASPVLEKLSPSRRHPQRGQATLVISHNKTLAAQLYASSKSFFPHNAVEYFVSYFDYYQPEAYIPRTDTFHRKRFQPQRGDRAPAPVAMSFACFAPRLIVVASVSCIYASGSQEDYEE